MWHVMLACLRKVFADRSVLGGVLVPGRRIPERSQKLVDLTLN